MANIGSFTVQPNGTYRGKIHTLTVRCQAQMIPSNSAAESAPTYRIFSGDAEIGAAWEKVREDDSLLYYSVKLDDPSFPAPIYGALFQNRQDGSVYDMVWDRPRLAN